MVAFRLQTVLNVRKIEEEKLQGELATLIKSILEAESTLNFLRLQKSQTLRILHEKQKEGMSAGEIGIYNTYLKELSDRISSQKKILKELEKARDKKREELIEASKRRKILEKLKEKKLLDALHEEMRRQQNFIDEIGVTRHNRQGMGREQRGI